jgi:hypothetical protein
MTTDVEQSNAGPGGRHDVTPAADGAWGVLGIHG